MMKRETITLAVILIGVFLFLASIQFSTPLAFDQDAYYHYTIAEFMRTRALVLHNFDYLTGNFPPGEFVDLQFLYHFILIPFTLLPTELGMKISQVFFASLSIALLYILLVQLKVKHAALWSLIALCSSYGFLIRIQFSKGVSLFICVSILFLMTLLNRKYILSGILGFLCAWLYPAFPLLGIYAVIGSITLTIHKRIDIKMVAYPMAGMIAGFFLYPYSPHSYGTWYIQTFGNFLFPTVVQGLEWHALTPLAFILQTGVLLIALIIGVVYAGKNIIHQPKKHRREIFFLVISIMYLGLSFMSKRFIEYLPFVIIPFAALTLSQVHQQKAKLIVAVLGIAALVTITISYPRLTTIIKDYPYSPYRYEGCMNALKAASPEGSIVYHDEWFLFPYFLHLNTHNRYVYGLDPTFGYAHNATKFKMWFGLINNPPEDAEEYIIADFDSQFVVITSAKNLQERITDHATTVYSDPWCTVLKLSI